MHMYATFLSWYYDQKPKNIRTAIKDNYCNNLVGLRFGSSTLKCADTCTLSVPIFLLFGITYAGRGCKQSHKESSKFANLTRVV